MDLAQSASPKEFRTIQTSDEFIEKPLKNLMSQIDELDSAPQKLYLQVECSSPRKSRTRQTARKSTGGKVLRKILNESIYADDDFMTTSTRVYFNLKIEY